jgi:hypothetical protein
MAGPARQPRGGTHVLWPWEPEPVKAVHTRRWAGGTWPLTAATLAVLTGGYG